MHNYSSAKLELLTLKWAVIEKFQDYLLGLQFQVYVDNNLHAYVQESKLDALQINGLVSWCCSILPSNTKQAIPTGPQMH